MRRLDLVCTFLVVTTVLSLAFGLGDGRSIAAVLDNTLLAAPALFFALFMVTEPLTAPPGRNARLAYAALVAVLYTPAVHIGELYFTPELALVLGNALAFVLSPKARLVLTLQARREIGAGQQELVFTADQPLRFRPGQFLEWTLGHGTPDQRGIRRYFTIASSPAEPVVRVGVKVPASKPSSFKTALAALRPGDQILASQLAGDFVLPDDPTVKLAFIAGGIGVTPFRAMLQYLMEQQEKRDIALLYSNNTPAEIAYRDTLAAAGETLGVRTIHTITVPEAVPPDWNGARGFIDARMIREQVPDFADRVFYVSGPQAMVSATVRALQIGRAHV